MLYDQIQADYIAAMKAHDELKKVPLNYVIAQCKNRKIELQKDLEDAEVIAILKKEIKARQEAVVFLEKANKLEDIEKENKIIEILSVYLPEMLSQEATAELVKKTIEELQITDLAKQRGEVVKAIMAEHKAVIDGRLLQDVINSLL